MYDYEPRHRDRQRGSQDAVLVGVGGCVDLDDPPVAALRDLPQRDHPDSGTYVAVKDHGERVARVRVQEVPRGREQLHQRSLRLAPRHSKPVRGERGSTDMRNLLHVF